MSYDIRIVLCVSILLGALLAKPILKLKALLVNVIVFKPVVSKLLEKIEDPFYFKNIKVWCYYTNKNATISELYERHEDMIKSLQKEIEELKKK